MYTSQTPVYWKFLCWPYTFIFWFERASSDPHWFKIIWALTYFPFDKMSFTPKARFNRICCRIIINYKVSVIFSYPVDDLLTKIKHLLSSPNIRNLSNTSRSYFKIFQPYWITTNIPFSNDLFGGCLQAMWHHWKLPSS